MIKRADSARGAPAPLRISCRAASSRSHGRILLAPFPFGNPLVTASVAAHLTHPIIVRRFGWRLAGVEWLRPFSPSSSPQSPLVDAASALVLLLRSCHRAARHTFSCSPPTGPPSSSSSPLPSFVQYFSFPLAHVLPRILVPTPQRIRRTPSGPAVHLGSLSAARQGVSGPRVVQPFIFTRYPLPGRCIRTASGPCVHLSSLSAARQGVSGPRVVQPFIFTRYPLPGRCIRTASGPAVHLSSLSATRQGVSGPRVVQPFIFTRCQEGVSGEPRVVQPFILARYPPQDKAYPDPEWSSRSSSLAIRCQEGVSGPRVVQPFILARYPPQDKAYRDPEWSSRPSSLATRRQEGVSGSRVVQPFIFRHYPLPGRRLRIPGGPAVHLHSLPAARKAYPDPGWSNRLSSGTIRCQEGVSGPRLV